MNEVITRLCAECGHALPPKGVRCSECGAAVLVAREEPPVGSVLAAPWVRARSATVAFVSMYCGLWAARALWGPPGAGRYVGAIAITCGVALAFYRALGKRDRHALATWSSLVTGGALLLTVLTVGWYVAARPPWFPFVLSPVQAAATAACAWVLRGAKRELDAGSVRN